MIMIKNKRWSRMIYLSVGLITIVVLLLLAVVVPFVATDMKPSATPEKAIPAILVSSIIHLLVVAALLWTIRAHNRKNRINKELLVASGILPIVLGLILMDGAFAYLDHPGMLVASIAMFLCVGLDILGGCLALIARYSRKKDILQKAAD